MKRFLRWLALVGGLIAATAVLFSLFTNLVVDYSLEDLQLALTAAEKTPEETSAVTQTVYHRVLQDMAVEEATREDVDLQSMILLELASRSFEEAVDRAGHSRAKFYLSQVALNKIPDDPFLRTGRSLFRVIQTMNRSLMSLAGYFQRHFFSQLNEAGEPMDFSNLLLLIQAEEKEKNWELDDAVFLYRKYLKLYPSRPDKGFVAISLAQILMKQKKYNEAERIVRDIRTQYGGAEEGNIAAAMLRKIESLRQREIQAGKLLSLIDSARDIADSENLRLRLALDYLSSYRYQEAQRILKELELSEDIKVRQKAKFYLGLIYNLNSNYSEGVEVLLKLLQDSTLEKEMGLGLHAELADMYYQQNNPEKSLFYYKALSDEGGKDVLSQRAASNVWVALAELGQAGIYYYDLHDPVEGAKHLARIREVLPDAPGLEKLKQEIDSTSREDLRDRAFEALKARKIHLAFDLFNKFLRHHPKDAWAHSGLGTVYIVMADLQTALEYAEKGYGYGPDEYTASVMGYVQGFYEHYEDAGRYYREALEKAKDYIPAQYNLACAYLETKRYAGALELLIGLDKTFRQTNNLMRSKILNNYGYSLWRLGRKDEARQRFRQALQVTPGFEDAKQNLGSMNAEQAPTRISLEK